MIKLSDSISKYLKNHQSDFLLFGTIQNEWEKIVGEKIAKATNIIKLEQNKLYIKCKNPTQGIGLPINLILSLTSRKKGLLHLLDNLTPKNNLEPY